MTQISFASKQLNDLKYYSLALMIKFNINHLCKNN